ncbi:MAG: type I-MYXAN CRISPR-associated protein Cas6/Cmx6 [Planctomycetaceae bacterium]|nr:type I-MYXAN CRISPR-associated protein Cas6/Cmx6 [Planctomycetaceae bacterium]
MPMIDLAFQIVGTTIPLDHGYRLFSALSRVLPQLHGDTRVGVHPIRGLRVAPGLLSLTEHSRLKLRLPSEEVAPYIALAANELNLDGHTLRVGIPRVEGLVPAAKVGSRLVTFRGALDLPRFEVHIRDELSRLEIAAEPSFIPSEHPRWAGQPKRRVVQIKDKRIVGYALRVVGLTAEESIRLQETGLGGRRRMGCGIFLPVGSL